jgi:hypothetical protein
VAHHRRAGGPQGVCMCCQRGGAGLMGGRRARTQLGRSTPALPCPAVTSKRWLRWRTVPSSGILRPACLPCLPALPACLPAHPCRCSWWTLMCLWTLPNATQTLSRCGVQCPASLRPLAPAPSSRSPSTQPCASVSQPPLPLPLLLNLYALPTTSDASPRLIPHPPCPLSLPHVCVV